MDVKEEHQELIKRMDEYCKKPIMYKFIGEENEKLINKLIEKIINRDMSKKGEWEIKRREWEIRFLLTKSTNSMAHKIKNKGEITEKQKKALNKIAKKYQENKFNLHQVDENHEDEEESQTQ